MNEAEIPTEVREALQIHADLDGFGGVIPGHLHFPNLLNTRQGLWTLFKSAVYGLFVVLIFSSTRNHVYPSEMMESLGDGPKRKLERSTATSFHMSPIRCTIGEVAWSWGDILFIRLVPPAIHSTMCTLQVFERNGPEHRWEFGADNYREIMWLVGRMKKQMKGNDRSQLPDALSMLLDQAVS